MAIITTALLPVPPVRGGAVEMLVDQLLQQNERHNQLEITVYGIYDKNAVTCAAGYKHSKFVFYRFNPFMEKLLDIFCRAAWKIFKIRIDSKVFFIDRVAKHINKCNYDLVLIENRPGFVLPVRRKTDARIMLHIHNDYLNPQTPDNKKIIDACDKVLVISQFIQNKALSISETPFGKVLILKNCIDTNLFNKDLYKEYRREFREQKHIHDDEIVLIFTGRLHPSKGIKELLQAFNKLGLNNIRLLVVGSSWYGSNAKDDFVKDLEWLSRDMDEKIIFTGYFPYTDMPKIYAVSDIAVVPSIWDEPAGLVVIEAMAAGLPLIVTESGGIPEYVNEACALLVKRDLNIVDHLAAAIRELVIREDLRSNMGNAGRIHAKQFDMENYYEEFVEIVTATIEEV